MTYPQKTPPKKRGGDQSFDDRALHLNRNIYGSDKGRLRLMVLQRDLSSIIEKSPPLSILDAGCGLGLMSEWALQNNHLITACDSAEIMIEETKKRLGEHPNVNYKHTTIQQLENTQYDIIFCHALLEWVEDQAALIDKLSRLLKPNGKLSLMFYNAWAREMAQLVYGNFDYIDKNYQVHQRVKLSPHYPATPDDVEQQLKKHNLTIKCYSGIRIFYDLLRDKRHYTTLADDIIRHELRISQQSPYWKMGRYVHFLAEKGT